ncbi:TPA: DUF4145 domain-containing protein [Bacillus cereus]|nr:DUF4145 domain-containing protein [Bacillus cereus]
MSKYSFQNPLKHPTFVCPHCSEIASHRWNYVYGPYWRQGHSNQTDIEYADPEYTFGPEKPTNPFEEGWLQGIIQAACSKCDSPTYWLKSMEGDELQVYPMNFSNYPRPHEDMPEHIRNTYIEAGSVLHLSLGASAALSRLTLENLLAHIGYDQGTLFNRIEKICANQDISSILRKKLDIVRLIGNKGTHVGSISFTEKPDTPILLLTIINDIVDDLITKPKSLASLEALVKD